MLDSLTRHVPVPARVTKSFEQTICLETYQELTWIQPKSMKVFVGASSFLMEKAQLLHTDLHLLALCKSKRKITPVDECKMQSR